LLPHTKQKESFFKPNQREQLLTRQLLLSPLQWGRQIGMIAATPPFSHREQHSRGACRFELQQLLQSLLLLAFFFLLECHTGRSTVEGQADRNDSCSSLLSLLLDLCFPLEYHTGSNTAEGQADRNDICSSNPPLLMVLCSLTEYHREQHSRGEGR
jgi:hypothetical protein